MKGKNILLVEDNLDDELLTLRALKSKKDINHITVVHDGALALDYLFARGDYEGRDLRSQPHLILLDLNLPKINGLEVLEKVRTTHCTKHIPVVVLTTSDENHDIISSYERGANSYVRKPVDYTRFMAMICQVEDYWLVLNEAPATVGIGE